MSYARVPIPLTQKSTELSGKLTSQISAESMSLSGPLTADLNYIRPNATIPPEVFYSGGSQPQTYNDAYAFMPANIQDGRKAPDNYQIHNHGFQLVTIPTRNKVFDDDKIIKNVYYREVMDIVRNETGAKDVFVFDHTARLGKTNSRRKPAHHVHNDYTESTALSRAEERVGVDLFAQMKGRRMIQINVWRPLVDIVHRSPLAFCDATTIAPRDLIPAQIHFPDTDHVGEIYSLRKNLDQNWFYFSEMTHDEVVLIKGYDSLTEGVARFTPHTAFEYTDQDPAIQPRHSIETRTFAFY